jgi:hypothetical protein
MAYTLTNEVIGALLVRGLNPIVEEAETHDDDDVLRFVRSDVYLAVGNSSVSWNERQEVGGNVLVGSWDVNSGDVPRAAANIVQEFWQKCGADLWAAQRSAR